MKYGIIGIIMAGILGGIFYLSLSNKPSRQGQENASSIQRQESEVPKLMENKLDIEDIKIGEGAGAKTGDTVFVHYTGTLLNGEKFDSSYDRGKPFSFTLGQGQVIQGWEEGILGMKVGGKRKLTIPSFLGYGERGVPGAIPPNATLVFEVELLDVK